MSLSFLLFQSCLFQGTLILGCEVFFSFFLFCIHVPLNAEKAYVNKCERVHLIKNSVALVRERTIPTERPPPVGEVSANFCG